MTEQNTPEDDDLVKCPSCDEMVEKLIYRDGYDEECESCIEGAEVLRDQEWDYWHA